MIESHIGLCVRIGVGLAVFALSASAAPTIPEEVKETIRDRVSKGVTPSVVVGVIDKTGQSFFSHGNISVENNVPANEDSIYEIGSITKVFTSILMADLEREGKLSITDPVQKYLPSSVTVPSRNGEITLEMLATHRSGLPRMPTNFAPADQTNPFADYDTERLYEFLSSHELVRDVNEKTEYSNVGVGLLGHTLTRVSGQSFEVMTLERICKPLGMASTVVTLSPELKTRLALGHYDNKVVPNWDLTSLAGAGALRSSVRDMLVFLSANIGLSDASIYPVLRRTHQRSVGPSGRELQVGLGWHYQVSPDMTIIWHNGGTGGYKAFCGFSPEKKAGVVVLSNSGNQGMDDVGIKLLQLHDGFEQGRTVVPIDATVLERYVGRYFIRPGAVAKVKIEEGNFHVFIPGSGNSVMFAESESSFFCKSKDAQVSFATDKSGKVTEMVLVHKGREQRARRLN